MSQETFTITFDEKPDKGYEWKNMGYIVPEVGDRIYIGEWAVIVFTGETGRYPTMRMVKKERKVRKRKKS